MKTTVLLVGVLALSCAAERTLDSDVQGQKDSARSSGKSSGQVLEANWKERLAQPYVYVEHVGDYRRMGEAMRSLFAAAESAHCEPIGAPFALFFDDPGHVPPDALRARACLPVAQRPAELAGLQFDLLPRAMVVYARVAGAYPEVAQSYPALFTYLRELGWRQGGPIREVYLVNPLDAQGYDDLVTEVQIPWIAGSQ